MKVKRVISTRYRWDFERRTDYPKPKYDTSEPPLASIQGWHFGPEHKYGTRCLYAGNIRSRLPAMYRPLRRDTLPERAGEGLKQGGAAVTHFLGFFPFSGFGVQIVGRKSIYNYGVSLLYAGLSPWVGRKSCESLCLVNVELGTTPGLGVGAAEYRTCAASYHIYWYPIDDTMTKSGGGYIRLFSLLLLAFAID